jgi:S-DNA-T family DNA segregation ATPase FtsK/SpoIIIE
MKRALEVIIVDRQASTSYIQRRLRIGYNRAAEIMDQLQERGIVGPPSGSGNKREILIFDGLEIN